MNHLDFDYLWAFSELIMGVDIQVWRARIGCFSQPASGKFKRGHVGIVIQRQRLSLAVKMCMFALLTICKSVESNPGPGHGSRDCSPAENTRASRSTKTLKDYSAFQPNPSDDVIQNTILKELREFKASYEQSTRTLNEKVDNLMADVTNMKEQVKGAQETADDAREVVDNLGKEVNRLQTKVEQLESQSRRDNLNLPWNHR